MRFFIGGEEAEVAKKGVTIEVSIGDTAGQDEVLVMDCWVDAILLFREVLSWVLCLGNQCLICCKF